VVALPEAAEAALQVLEFAAGQRGEGRQQGGQAGPRTDDGHQVDGGVAGRNVAAVAGATAGTRGQVVLAPTPLPVDQGAAGHAEALGYVVTCQAATPGPTVEGHRVAADRAIGFAPLALRWPATFRGLYGTGVHRLLGWG
jgi:hypothetical protein